jgi:hypothetical protein
VKTGATRLARTGLAAAALLAALTGPARAGTPGSARTLTAEPSYATPPHVTPSSYTRSYTAAVSSTTASRVTTIITAPTRREPIAPALPASPRSHRLNLHGQYQDTTYYCVPAATAMSLSTFGVNVAQGILAQKMATTLRGTGGDEAAKVMDAYIHPRHYDDKLVGDVVGEPSVLMERVAYDVGTLHRAPVIQVWMEQLPWNKGQVTGRFIGHAIIAYGYSKQTGTITVFDPWRPTGGAHTLPVTALAMSLQAGAGMHYISRL